ncbi:hypothetical protein LCGC14_0892100 [marine sediment metagenome]|uniref:Uncharacterized protein n=1 Tax=marine sediment metagenome TaxID=412755 RepID=A0A0F9PJL5_9ZZZZ
MSETKYPLPPENGPYRLAIYDGKDELVTIITQVKVDNVRPKVEELVDLILHPAFKSRVLQSEHLLEKARALESALNDSP